MELFFWVGMNKLKTFAVKMEGTNMRSGKLMRFKQWERSSQRKQAQ